MCVIVSNCSIHLTRKLDLLHVPDLLLQPIRKIGELFAQSCGSGGLAMSASQHCIGSPLHTFAL